MKKLLLAASLLMITSMTAMAQLPSFTFGIKGGINFSSLKTKNDLTDQNNIMGYQAGIFSRVGAAGIYIWEVKEMNSYGSKTIMVLT